ncbi:hypothetical protein B296_00055026 [Ensete ventricosum]|uniref:Uncharacterized protein n=1 Tax=Ensete ventricosum TaxID=4639 RepID=A0A426X1A3_ENSVE|nr:hypothetical protein B296_00055026 [Ensete ventricosum]
MFPFLLKWQGDYSRQGIESGSVQSSSAVECSSWKGGRESSHRQRRQTMKALGRSGWQWKQGLRSVVEGAERHNDSREDGVKEGTVVEDGAGGGEREGVGCLMEKLALVAKGS